MENWESGEGWKLDNNGVKSEFAMEVVGLVHSPFKFLLVMRRKDHRLT